MQVEFTSIVEKGKWIVIPYHTVQQLPGLQLTSPRVKVERYPWPQWLVNNCFNANNTDNLPLVHLTTMQYSRDLDRLLLEIVHGYIYLGSVYILK